MRLARPRPRAWKRFMTIDLPTWLRRRPARRRRGCGCSRRWRSPIRSTFLTSSAMRLLREGRDRSERVFDLLAADQRGNEVQLLRADTERAQHGAAPRCRRARRGALALPMLLPLGLLVGAVAVIGPRRREFAELVADHVFVDRDRDMLAGRCGRRRSGRRTAAGWSSGATRS